MSSTTSSAASILTSGLRRITVILAFVFAVLAGHASVAMAVTTGQQSSATPARDRSAQSQKGATASISGRVLGADNGRPIKRARIALSGTALPGGRTTVTDEAGHFEFTDLPGGRYSLTASKVGFVNLSYGQRRPLQSGVPLLVQDAQQVRDVDFRLPRGGVITGHIVDEDNEPLPGALVRVMRYQYQQGERRLVPAGAGQTDDRGQFRVWGLSPGQYYISANARPVDRGRGMFGGFSNDGGPEAETAIGYAATYYPGVATPAEASPIAVGVSQEVQDIDFGLQLVKVARITGVVVNPNGAAATSGNVTLVPEGTSTGRGMMGGGANSRIDGNGNFTLTNVAPGRYILRARSTDMTWPAYAATPVTVAGVDLTGVNVLLAAGATVTGTISFETANGEPPNDLSQFHVVTYSSGDNGGGARPDTAVERDGTFYLNAVPAGSHSLRTYGPRAWTLKGIYMNGADITDTPLDLRSGQKVAGVQVVFTDRVTLLSGAVTDSQGRPMTDYTIIAFATETTLWRPQARQIAATRPDQSGRFEMRALPPGQYYLAAVGEVEQGQWFEPGFLEPLRAGAMTVTLAEGETKAQNLQVAQP